MNVASVIMFVVLLIYALSLILMYVWGFTTSVKSNYLFRTDPFGPPRGWPWQWEWSNYAGAYSALSVKLANQRVVLLPEMAFNSIFFSILGATISLSVTWLVAYLTSTFNRPFSKFVYRANIVLMMIPIVGSLPSALQIYKALGLYDTWGYVAIGSIGFTGSNFLIFHAYFKTIGNGIKEAASIDGAGNFNIMLRIIFPISFKMFGILFILAFISRWNDYMTMVIWLPSKPTLAYGMYRLGTSTETAVSWPPIQFAGCMILMLPILVLFLIFRDKIIGQVTMGALKG